MPPSTLPGEAPATPDPVPVGVATTLGPYRLVGRADVFGPVSDQGLATVGRADGTTAVVYRGTLDVTPTLRAQGWDHVGDPGGWRGWVVDAFQGRPDAKVFRSTGPDGQVVEAVHPLAPSEEANNSFAAVSPDGRLTVSGEWQVERRFLVFPTPGVAAPASSSLPLVGTVALDRPARDVQGCAFVDAVTLVCATADPGTDLWPVPDQVLRVRLARPLTASIPAATGAVPPATPATVTLLGPVPAASLCVGAYEPEGVDVDPATGRLRVEVVPPGQCATATQVYEYRPG
ncbi:MAG TPA: hypothetical protein VFP61_02440 [Acidimicrobiales bacterium]|nr:hypothetical protein [Acidimicrobiales bacterium]